MGIQNRPNVPFLESVSLKKRKSMATTRIKQIAKIQLYLKKVTVIHRVTTKNSLPSNAYNIKTQMNILTILVATVPKLIKLHFSFAKFTPSARWQCNLRRHSLHSNVAGACWILIKGPKQEEVEGGCSTIKGRKSKDHSLRSHKGATRTTARPCLALFLSRQKKGISTYPGGSVDAGTSSLQAMGSRAFLLALKRSIIIHL